MEVAAFLRSDLSVLAPTRGVEAAAVVEVNGSPSPSMTFASSLVVVLDRSLHHAPALVLLGHGLVPGQKPILAASVADHGEARGRRLLLGGVV